MFLLVNFDQYTQHTQLFCAQCSSSENRLSSYEMKHDQEELVDHNVLFSQMLHEIHACDVTLKLPSGQMCLLFIGF